MSTIKILSHLNTNIFQWVERIEVSCLSVCIKTVFNGRVGRATFLNSAS
jgi:hypothetical protein